MREKNNQNLRSIKSLLLREGEHHLTIFETRTQDKQRTKDQKIKKAHKSSTGAPLDVPNLSSS
jgi:hypothetical protein